MHVVGPSKFNRDAILHHTTYYDVIPQKLVPIILKLFSILFATYYSQNYSSIIYKGLTTTLTISLLVG